MGNDATEMLVSTYRDWNIYAVGTGLSPVPTGYDYQHKHGGQRLGLFPPPFQSQDRNIRYVQMKIDDMLEHRKKGAIA